MIENKLVRFNDGDILFSAGDNSRSMYIIRSGKVKVLINKDGKEIPLIELGRGHYVGEMSFLTGVKRSATVVADSGVIASKIDPDMLNEDNLGLSNWAVSIARVLVRRIRSTTELLGDYLISDGSLEPAKGQRAEDMKILEIENDNVLHPERIYLKGQFSEASIEPLKTKIREIKMMRIFPVILDFSDVIDIDQSGINFIFNLTRTSDVAEEIVKIENMQLIRDKVLAIKGLQGIMTTTQIPTKCLEQNDVLIKQGDLENVMYVVKSGSFAISRKTKSSKVKLAVAEAGDVIGEMSLIKEGFRSADVISNTTSIVHVIDIREFYNNIYNVPGWFMELIKGLVQRLRDTNEMLDQICNDKAEKQSVKDWRTPFNVILDSTRPGCFVITGTLSLSNLQYFVPLINLEIKRKTKHMSIDLSKVKYIEKESISGLLSIYTQLKNKGITVEIRGPKKVMSNILKEYKMNG